MCYNITYLQKRGDKYAARYSPILPVNWNRADHVIDELPEYYFVSGFAHPKLPIVKHDGIFLFEWGLIPQWVKDEKQAKEMRIRTLNAVGETAFEKPSFRKSIASQRCLLGVNGFFEWRDLNKVKYPYYIQHATEETMSLGCIYESWVNKATGEIKNTFSIVTSPANPMMEKIHNLKKRMPLIIDRENEKEWINPALGADEVKALLKSYPQEKMKAHTVSNMVNSAKNYRNVPGALEECVYAELD